MGYMTLPASKMPPPVTEFAHDLPHLSCVSISPCLWDYISTQKHGPVGGVTQPTDWL